MTGPMADPTPDPEAFQEALPGKRRWIPLAVIGCLMVVVYAFGFHEQFSLQSIAAHREELRQFIADNWALALLIYAVAYVAAVALSFPAAGLLTVIGGLLFGWLVGAITTIFAATAGATIIFLAARTSLEKVLARKSGPLLNRIREGFARDAFSYLLFLRLVPLFPFWLVNIASALAHLRLKTFVSATFLGIIPITIAFSFVGASLDSVIDAQKAVHEACLAQGGPAACPFDFSAGRLLTPQVLIALAALGILALIPVAMKRLRKKP
jgi:uncharacterized membrane protein YdjX (TVP38/TMEM64 family)